MILPESGIDRRQLFQIEKERSSVITTPVGCIRTCTGSFLSKKILFVAIARTLSSGKTEST